MGCSLAALLKDSNMRREISGADGRRRAQKALQPGVSAGRCPKSWRPPGCGKPGSRRVRFGSGVSAVIRAWLSSSLRKIDSNAVMTAFFDSLPGRHWAGSFATIKALGLGRCLLVIPIFLTATARADDASARSLLARAIVSANVGEQVGLIDELAQTGSDVVPVVLNAWREGGVFIHETPEGQKVTFLRLNGKATRVDDGSPLEASETTPVGTTAKLRKAMKNTLDVLMIAGPDPQARRAAVTKLGMSQNAAYLPAFEARLAIEKDPSVAASLREAMAIIRRAGTDWGAKIAAIDYLTKSRVIRGLDLLKKLSSDPDPQVAAAASKSVASIEGYLHWVDLLGTLFRGLSLGSILLVAALGLAITFGLMGVINMA